MKRLLTINERSALECTLKENKPLHWFHLLLTVLTGGIWAPIWACYSGVLCHSRNTLRGAYGVPYELNIGAIICLMFVILFITVLLSIGINLRGY